MGELSDIKIGQIQTSLCITYIYSNNLSLYAKYMYKEYNDRENNYLDGQFSLVSFGMSWTF